MKIKISFIVLYILLFTIAISVNGLKNSDQLDQQSVQNDDTNIITNRHLAQSFTPTLPIFTRTWISLYKASGNAMYDYYYLAIKDSLEGSVLTQINIDRNDIVTGSNWYEFNFSDISIEPGNTYYIIVYGTSSTGDTASVSWDYGHPDPYANGNAWRNTPAGWFELDHSGEKCDFCFKTYGESLENIPPNKPIKPVGPTYGYIDVEYRYFSSTTDPDNNLIAYRFDFENRITDWTMFTESGVGNYDKNTWSIPGTYQVKAQAKDIHHAESPWSDAIMVLISDGNGPPSIPIQPIGETRGRTGYELEYASLSTDPDGDQIYYMFDWGDGNVSGWIGPKDSGSGVTAVHIWTVDGTYKIKVRAKDVNDAESEWSDPLSVSMPKNKNFNQIFLQYLKNYPLLSPILRYLLV